MPLALKDFPDHHDAELVLKLYELRREAVMRESRSAINRNFWPRTIDDVMAVTKTDHPLNAPFRQVTTYWEMAYGMIRHGVLHADFMLECNGAEGMFVFARMQPFIAEYRVRHGSPHALVNTEWVATNTEAGRRFFELFRQRVEKTLAAK